MKSSFFFFLFIFLFVITMFLSSRNSYYHIKTVSLHSGELEGAWEVDYAFNQIEWDTDIANNISHQWYEKIVFKKDTFFLEDHEWWPPRKSNNGIEYFPFEGKYFIKGLYRIKQDTLVINGHYTDYLYSDNTDDSGKYFRTFAFTINTDTLELSVNAAIKYRLIRNNK